MSKKKNIVDLIVSMCDDKKEERQQEEVQKCGMSRFEYVGTNIFIFGVFLAVPLGICAGLLVFSSVCGIDALLVYCVRMILMIGSIAIACLMVGILTFIICMERKK